jgi:hypothetical protein
MMFCQKSCLVNKLDNPGEQIADVIPCQYDYDLEHGSAGTIRTGEL